MLGVIADSIIKSAIFEEKRLFTVIEPEIKSAIFKFQRSDIIKVQQQIGYGLKCIFSIKLNILKMNLKIVETFCYNADIRWVYIKKEFDDDILNFLAQEVDNAAVRKKEANERRRLKKKEAKEQKVRENIIKQADATTRTVAAAEPLLQEIGIPNASLLTQI